MSADPIFFIAQSGSKPVSDKSESASLRVLFDELLCVVASG